MRASNTFQLDSGQRGNEEGYQGAEKNPMHIV